MQEHYAIFDLVSGNIVQWGTCGPGESVLWEPLAGLGILAGPDGPWTSRTHHLVGGAPVAYTAEQAAAKRQRQAGMKWSNATMAWVDERSLDEIKAAKNSEINAARLAANRGTFTHSGKTFACDELSRSDIDGVNGIVALIDALPPSWPGAWKAADNSYLAIATVGEWTAFYAAMVAQGTTNFVHAQSLKAALAAATTPGEVAAIHW